MLPIRSITLRDNSGFSLVELLVVVAIIGILAAVGVVGYQGYIDSTKKEAAEFALDSVARSFEQDYIAIKNGIEVGSDVGTYGGNTVVVTDQCISYVRKAVDNLNNAQRIKNAYDQTATLALNLHDDGSGVAHTALKPGQIGIQCANPEAVIDSSNFYIHQCTCTGTDDCTLHTFTNASTSQEKTDYENHVNDASKAWRTDGSIKLGKHVPDWVCPRADYYSS